jgi:RNA polymerase sigma-70 factor, ECF subfamily
MDRSELTERLRQAGSRLTDQAEPAVDGADRPESCHPPTANEVPAATDQILPLIYDQLHALAMRQLANERDGHTLQPTALVHEAYLRMVDVQRIPWAGRTHFYAMAAIAMRRVLVDHAREKLRQKRGAGITRVPFQPDAIVADQREPNVIALEEALDELRELDPRQAQVVSLKTYGGMTMEEIATALQVSKRTVEGDWKMARAWLLAKLRRDW